MKEIDLNLSKSFSGSIKHSMLSVYYYYNCYYITQMLPEHLSYVLDYTGKYLLYNYLQIFTNNKVHP